MLILGLNSCKNRSHDASACLLKDDKIIAFAEEERFVRQKRAFDCLPVNSIRYCLDQANIHPNQIDIITFGFAKRKIPKTQELFPDFMDVKKIPVKLMPHHLAHAASTYFTSGFQESAILIVDGQGEPESGSIFKGTGDKITLLKKYDCDRSLGYFYATISIFCGLGTFGAGKLMGLAAYGKPIYLDQLKKAFKKIKLRKNITQENPDNQDEYIDQLIKVLESDGFIKAKIKENLDPITGKITKEPLFKKTHKDLASSAQKLIEEIILEQATESKKITKSDNLCLGGGVAMNCVANSVIENSKIFKNLFIQPACEDSGVALGSSLALLKKQVELDPYLGPEYKNNHIKKILDQLKLKHKFYKQIEKKTASLINDGNIVGWFQGKMEYGPRALGNRSILADPRVERNKIRLNIAKGREIWRPFAPSILEERATEILANYTRSPYMLKSYLVTKKWQRIIPATVHHDGSTRPQTVSKQMNKRYYNLISEFYNITGVPAVINTSFNYAGEPVVCSPYDAIRTFYTSGLDYLVLGNYVIEK